MQVLLQYGAPTIKGVYHFQGFCSKIYEMFNRGVTLWSLREIVLSKIKILRK